MPKGTMKLIDERTGLMECATCGAVHSAMMKPDSGGKFYRGSWHCHNCQVNQ